MPAADSQGVGALPIGLAHQVKVLRPVAAGEALTWDDVEFDADSEAVRFRHEMEMAFRA